MKIERLRQLAPERAPRAGDPADSSQSAVVAVGNFDGLHLGHQRALLLARREARARGAEFVAVTFDPHPARLLRPDRAPKSICGAALKTERLAALGVERLVVVEFNEAVASATPARFVKELLVSRLGARAVVQGGNFRFGRNRRGDLETLRRLGARHGFTVIEAAPVEWAGEVVSSTRIRRALAAGDLDLAAALLGRPYEVLSPVVPGRGRGGKLGFPTANLDGVAEVLLPPGVYAAEAETDPRTAPPEGQAWPAVVHCGPRPTFVDSPSLEAHLIGFSGRISALRLRFRAFLREIEAFASADLLRRQLERDIARVREPAVPEPVPEALPPAAVLAGGLAGR